MSVYIEKRPDIPNELAALREIAANTSAGGGGGSGGSYPEGSQRTQTTTTATADGSVAAGSKGVQFILSSDFVGTIDGATFAGSSSAFWSPPPLVNAGDTYPAIAYTISAGNAIINVLT